MSADLLNDPRIAQSYAELRNQDSPIDWFFVEYDPQSPKDKLALADRGQGGLQALNTSLRSRPTAIYFGIIRHEGRFLLFTCLPDDAGGIRRARGLVHSRSLAAKFPTHASVTVGSHNHLNENLLRSKLKLDTGSAPSSLPPSPNPQLSHPTASPSPSPLRSQFSPQIHSPGSTFVRGHRRNSSAQDGPAPMPPEKDEVQYALVLPRSPQPVTPGRPRSPNTLSPAMGSPRLNAPIYATHASQRPPSPASAGLGLSLPGNGMSPRQRVSSNPSPSSSPTLQKRTLTVDAGHDRSRPSSPSLLLQGSPVLGSPRFGHHTSPVPIAAPNQPPMASQSSAPLQQASRLQSSQSNSTNKTDKSFEPDTIASMFTSSSPRTSVHTNASDLHQSAPHALSNGNGAEQSVSNRKSIGGASDAAELAYDGIEDEAPAGSAERRLASEEQPYLPSSSTKEQVALQQQFRKDLEEQHAREEQEREEALRQRREAAALISIQRAQAEEAAAEMLRQTQKEAALKQEIEAEDRRKAIEEDALQEAEKTKSDRAAAEQEASARAQQERDEAARRAAQEEQALKDQEAARRMETKENARRDVALRIQQAASDEQVILTGFVSIQGGSSVIWRRRFFHLTASTLILYKSAEDVTHPVDTVVLSNKVKLIDFSAEELMAIPYSFKIIFKDYDDEPVLFYCDEVDDYDLLVYAVAVAAKLQAV